MASHSLIDGIDSSYAVHRVRNSSDSSFRIDRTVAQWVIPGNSYQASLPCDDMFIETESYGPVELGRGSMFHSKDAMVSDIALYHLKNCLEFRNRRSDTSRYHNVCKFEKSCKFSVRGKALGLLWKIYEWIPHTCKRDLRRGPHPKVSSRAIAAHMGANLSEDGYELRPRDIQGQILREFGVNLKYYAALAGRNLALNMAYGDQDKSFQLLPKYLYMLQKFNSGSIVDLQVHADGSFEYYFFALSSCLRAFPVCRPIVVIDATHLKGKYKGVMFVASTKDANEHIVPLAFGIGDKENDSAWSWFLAHVRQSFGVRDNMLIVSDQHASIKNAVLSVFPGVAHGFCSYHIQDKLRGEDVIDLFQSAANAYRVEDFDKQMNNLRSASSAAYVKLLNIGPANWARSKCPVRRFSFGTSNAVECLNARLRWARKLPICSLLEYARNLTQEWFCKRCITALSRGLELSDYVMRRLEDATIRGRIMKVEPISDSKFKDISGVKSYIVDILARECSCRVFQLDLIPCSHATRVFSHLNQVSFGYVGSCYTTEMWRETYATEVMPVPDPSDWHVPVDIDSLVVGTPSNPKQAGRPRIKRYQVGADVVVESDAQGDAISGVDDVSAVDVAEVVESVGCADVVEAVGGSGAQKQVRLCSRCHKKGHYQTTCKTFIEITCEDGVDVIAKRARKMNSCGICGVVGHTRRTCNDPNRF